MYYNYYESVLNKDNKLKSVIKEVALILKLTESQTKILKNIVFSEIFASWTNKNMKLALY